MKRCLACQVCVQIQPEFSLIAALYGHGNMTWPNVTPSFKDDLPGTPKITSLARSHFISKNQKCYEHNVGISMLQRDLAIFWNIAL